MSRIHREETFKFNDHEIVLTQEEREEETHGSAVELTIYPEQGAPRTLLHFSYGFEADAEDKAAKVFDELNEAMSKTDGKGENVIEVISKFLPLQTTFDYSDSVIFKKLLPQVEHTAIDALSLSLEEFTKQDAIAVTNRICEDRDEDFGDFRVELTDVEALDDNDDWSDVNSGIETMIEKYRSSNVVSRGTIEPPYSAERIKRFEQHVRLVSHAMSSQTITVNKYCDFEYADTDVYGETEYLHLKWIPGGDHRSIMEFDLDGESQAYAFGEIIKAAESADYVLEDFIAELKKLDLQEV